MAKAKGNSASSPKKSPKQEAFEREAREKLENADMVAFDRMMKRLVRPTIGHAGKDDSSASGKNRN
jgi:hypothetical protein